MNHSISELGKTKEELAESKSDAENFQRKISTLEAKADFDFNHRKELEGRIIVLQNELQDERKKLINQTGLEKSLNELRHQMSLKTSEIVELGQIVEREKEIMDESSQLKELIKGFQEQISQLKGELEETKEQNWNLNRKLEAANSSNEQERVKMIDVMNENKSLESSMDQIKQSFQKKQRETDLKLKEVQEKLRIAEEGVKLKEEEFERYKSKVHRVLSEKQAEHQGIEDLKKTIESYEENIQKLEDQMRCLNQELSREKEVRSNIEQLLSESETKVMSLKTESDSLIESVKRENDSLKKLSRDLQCELVSFRSELDKQIEALENGHSEKQQNLKDQLEKLRKELEAERNDKKAIQAELQATLNLQRRSIPPNLSLTESRTSDSSTLAENGTDGTLIANDNNHNDDSPKSCDDIDSIESTSLPSRTKRLSVSSGSEVNSSQMNGLLDEDESTSRRSPENKSNFERLRELLEESESSNLLLTEQNRILKEEIRRLERAISRTEVAQNLEYLKNILIKFISLETGSSEKQQLIPVIKTILKLDSNEEKLLTESAAAEFFTASPDDHSASESWTSFLWGSGNSKPS